MASTDSADLSHKTIQPLAVGLIFAFPTIATVALALRIYSRSLTRTFAADDIVIGIAGVLYWAFTYVSYKVIKVMYIGYHIWDIPKNFDLTLGLKFGYASEILYNPILALVKTSILLFLLRLTGQKTAVRNSIWAILIFNFVMMATTFLLTVFHCTPVQANWYPASYPDAKCLNFADFVTGTASVGILTDALVLILPTWIVYDLKIQQRQKIMLIGILSFGLVTVICGIVRVILLDNYDRHEPVDYNYSVLFCLSTFEVGLSFIAACAPSFKPIISQVLPKIFGGITSSNGPYSKAGTRGYQLDQVTRRTEVNRTQVGADSRTGERDGYDDGKYGDSKGGIVVNKTTEVRWNDRAEGEKASSTDSLV